MLSIGWAILPQQVKEYEGKLNRVQHIYTKPMQLYIKNRLFNKIPSLRQNY
ncbi:hypothetical protein [Olivibacter sitiensis]|uniref:hypothetical protein n=1 Tax=Olivibacter sitiensis TaxID=376470 RepID=UPI0004269F17|nr:hypothetical protein [Olivibacter sitiensis]